MREEITVTRPANGSGTVVTVKRTEDGITARYSLKSTGTAIGKTTEVARRAAADMLRQVREEVDR